METNSKSGVTLVETLVGVSLAVLFIFMFAHAYLYISATLAKNKALTAATLIASNNLARYKSADTLISAGLTCNTHNQLHNALTLTPPDSSLQESSNPNTIIVVSQQIKAYIPKCQKYIAIHSIVTYKRHSSATAKTIEQISHLYHS